MLKFATMIKSMGEHQLFVLSPDRLDHLSQGEEALGATIDLLRFQKVKVCPSARAHPPHIRRVHYSKWTIVSDCYPFVRDVMPAWKATVISRLCDSEFILSFSFFMFISNLMFMKQSIYICNLYDSCRFLSEMLMTNTLCPFIYW